MNPLESASDKHKSIHITHLMWPW